MPDKLAAAAMDLAVDIEELLVRDNPRGMAELRRALPRGYLLRGAQHLIAARETVAIITGFPVNDTFETDGPAGAWVLYDFLVSRGCQPVIIAEHTVLRALGRGRRSIPITNTRYQDRDWLRDFTQLKPSLAISIERPGAAADGHFYNLRGVDISASVVNIETLLSDWTCPLIAIGDGGNELGMGKVASAVAALDIIGAVTCCDELIVADVSNWGAYALVAMSQHLLQMPVLEDINLEHLLAQLVNAGAVDGITHKSAPTEDGLAAEHGERLIMDIRERLLQR